MRKEKISCSDLIIMSFFLSVSNLKIISQMIELQKKELEEKKNG